MTDISVIQNEYGHLHQSENTKPGYIARIQLSLQHFRK